MAAIMLSGSFVILAGANAMAETTARSDLTAKDLARVRAVTSAPASFAVAEPFEMMAGGAATSRKTPDGNAFSHSSANLDFEGERDFKLGNALFRKLWVSSPSSTQASDGLGPLYNARSCQRCHLKDGRGHPPGPGESNATSMFLRLSVPPQTATERAQIASGAVASLPEPTYGGQLQDFAVPGLAAEGRMVITYREEAVPLSGGETASLRHPTYTVGNPAFGPLHPETLLSPRVASQMIGLGLLEAIHPDDIHALSDPDDRDGDGISGRVSIVRDAATGDETLGRFGWKAGNPTVAQQSADALAGDIGVSSPLAPRHHGDCTPAQSQCLQMATGVQVRLGETEAPDPVLPLIAHYARNLAVPARRDVSDAAVLKGKRLFHETGCTGCHQPKFVTRRDTPFAEHRFQLIWPFTDMLLHDMGEALSDNRPVGSASGREWRTAPLWGIGLTEVVNGHTFFLHDGRARNLLEAILWHGGEAEAARDKVVEMPPEDRAALIRFLESL
ncbi:MAG: di-heme oxidoredictase family protein [Minwuia sp.]|nr:di-heme oxidoredictase family protein [Minwuia sp.]